MKKKIFRKWLVKLLGSIIIGYMFFIGMTIETLGTNRTYDYIFIIWTILTLISTLLLKLHTNILD